MASSLKCVFIAALILHGAVGLFNPGFIAVDDYASNIEMVVPAQTKTYQSVIEGSEFRPPYSNIFYLSVTKVGQTLGLEHPMDQLRLLRVALALITVLLFFLSSSICFEKEREQLVAFGLLCFYFLSPLIFSRVLIEANSAPWLLFSAAFCVRYWKRGTFSDLAWAILCLFGSTLIRYQNGICFLPLLTTPLLLRRWKDTVSLSLIGISLFLLVGFADFVLKGNFHSSLVSYVSYNLQYSSSYGRVPMYAYLALFLAITFPPFLIGRYRELDLKRYHELLPLVGYFAIFVAIHSVIPHKEERFVLPVLPIFLFLCVPFVHYWIERRAIRIWMVFLLNGILLSLSAIQVPQANVVNTAVFVDKNPWIKKIMGYQDTLSVFPRVYINRLVTEERVDQLDVFDCASVVAIRTGLIDRPANFARLARFEPGMLESVLIRLNPAKNARRGPIELWHSKSCASLRKT